ncbi:penicillin-binding protein 2 [Pseudazoarcus pumilus]|uniref:Peptidoglycan D,D-transpeptidase MrdA n=1 Tax=Pseudazoarcus pumilus TaxID=2067960 RepID=A0A2I6SA90_9RHOO|nr:penicillin-binding protein 2 [Pseudazoarcus pumilus]AUN96173.1 penicillin-binding protein 2 [Pseudazoarcus pumilus]
MTEFRAPQEALFRFRRRAVVAAVFVALCFVVLAARLYHLQVAQYDYFHSRAEGNRVAVLPVVPRRGVIHDRHGEVLARNYSAWTVEINPAQVRDLDAALAELGEVLPFDERDDRRFRRRLQETKYFESVPLRTHLNDEEVAAVAARLYRLPGVELRARLFRDYPNGESAAHAIGYIGRINERELQRIDARGETANYRGSEYMGKSGIELAYERELHGVTGVEQIEVNASGRAVRLLARTAPVNGSDLELSLHMGLQRAAEAALGSRRGAVVAIEPATGEVLALVSTPSYDPNLFIDGISVADWRALSDSPEHPLLNRAIYSAYPPGSTYKPFMALAGLASGIRMPEDSFDNQGLFTVGAQRLVDRKSKCQHGVDLHRSIVYSCNTYYYELAHEMGIEAIAAFMSQFGFGSRTGIDIPGEAPGVLPSPAWKRARFKSREHQQWYGGETISVAIGQGYNAYTPLQMAHALSVVLNYGEVRRPHLVRRIVDGLSGEIRHPASQPERFVPLVRSHVDALKRAMVDVTKVGTASAVFADAPYDAGGKTGTAQVFSLRGQKYVSEELAERLRDHAWFIGFAPAEAPTIALAVFVENGGFGSQSAAPVARKLFDYYLLGRRVESQAGELDEVVATELEP